MRIRYGKFADNWRGDGLYVSISAKSRYLLIALRWKWRFKILTPEAKPAYRRIYFGPLELEYLYEVST